MKYYIVTITVIAAFITLLTFNLPASFSQQETGSTFTSNGWLDSTTIANGTEQYLIGGKWNLAVVNGDLFDFKADFTTVLTNGSDRHTMGFTHFRADNATKITLRKWFYKYHRNYGCHQSWGSEMG